MFLVHGHLLERWLLNRSLFRCLTTTPTSQGSSRVPRPSSVRTMKKLSWMSLPWCAFFFQLYHSHACLTTLQQVNIPPRNYCVVGNPHVYDEKYDPVFEENGQIKLRHGDIEVRLSTQWKNPFPLFPGEFVSIFSHFHTLQWFLRRSKTAISVARGCYRTQDCSCQHGTEIARCA